MEGLPEGPNKFNSFRDQTPGASNVKGTDGTTEFRVVVGSRVPPREDRTFRRNEFEEIGCHFSDLSRGKLRVRM